MVIRRLHTNVFSWLYILLAAILSTHAAESSTQLQSIPRLPNSTLLIGWGPPDSMALSSPKRTLFMLPEDQQRVVGGPLIYPSITLDGSTIASARLRSTLPRRVAIATYSVGSKKWTEYVEGAYSGSIAITKDGSKLAFPGEYSDEESPSPLHILDLNAMRQSNGPSVSPLARISWAPDGLRLVFECPRASSLTARNAIAVYDMATGKITSVAYGFSPSWSPSGEWIAYFSESGKKVMMVHPDGSNLRQVAVSSDLRLFPVWSPDSTHLLLNQLTDENGGVNIYIVDLKTLKLKKIFQNKQPVVGWAHAP